MAINRPADVVDRIGITPVVKKVVRKYWYPFMTRQLEAEDMVFLNWGYEEDPPVGLPLEDADEPNRYYIQLYHATATEGGGDLAGKRVLEVSCGHGGAASYFTRTMKPASYTGLDFNPDGIAFCKKRHQLPGLDFVHGDAENLPFPDESFDAVINLEASHNYLQFSRFLSEVARVLVPGGRFQYADLRNHQEFADWDADLDNAPLRKLSQRDINAEVLRGLDLTEDRAVDLIDRRVPAPLRPFARQFSVVPGSRNYNDVKSGAISYRAYSFIKE
ncbi:MAG: phthiotriol/phenolphthiotriol dimycocerosates methyltransferase [Mycolicibacterium sp.]|uniref:phthiotriol/phenolphthiotriol dimycocerosates methyltransferase n=1 Tax=Mycolicibacterium sp. TaxID=2320850 RepID=UPI003D136C5D